MSEESESSATYLASLARYQGASVEAGVWEGQLVTNADFATPDELEVVPTAIDMRKVVALYHRSIRIRGVIQDATMVVLSDRLPVCVLSNYPAMLAIWKHALTH